MNKGWYEPNEKTMDKILRASGIPCYNCDIMIGCDNVSLSRIVAKDFMPEGCNNVMVICKNCKDFNIRAPYNWEDIIEFKKSKDPIYTTQQKLTEELEQSITKLNDKRLRLLSEKASLEKQVAQLDDDLEEAKYNGVMSYKTVREQEMVKMLDASKEQLKSMVNLTLMLENEVTLIDNIKSGHTICRLCKETQKSYDIGGEEYNKAMGNIAKLLQ